MLWCTYKCFTHFGRPSFDSGFSQGLGMRLSITSKSKVPNWSGCVVCGVTLENCLPVPRGALAKSKVGETLAWRHYHDLIFSAPNVYTKCSYWIDMSDICCTVHFVQEEGRHQRLHTAGLGRGGSVASTFYMKQFNCHHRNSSWLFLAIMSKSCLICVDHNEDIAWHKLSHQFMKWCISYYTLKTSVSRYSL